ncbi:hypothetical protein HK105_209462 [Polyrhizophydium stewartii]|uniref:Hyaluronan/mRNA-binding protein domain-containing protein n=1 Tax=Polyrhizophydium stewartii TaxID=2732419 RepID=A0ABR4MV04_9FUNG
MTAAPPIALDPAPPVPPRTARGSTGRPDAVKKDGAGRGNWGKPLDQQSLLEARIRATMPVGEPTQQANTKERAKKNGGGRANWGSPLDRDSLLDARRVAAVAAPPPPKIVLV